MGHTRGGHLQVTRPTSFEQIGRSIYRDASLLQGQVKGVVDLSNLPASTKHLEEQLIDVKNIKHRETPIGERLVPQVRRSRRWLALTDAKNDGDLDKLRGALKAAQLD